jgi:hypothetical protein
MLRVGVENIDFWRLCDELTVVQAALLVVGHDPSSLEICIENKIVANQPKGYNATKNALLSAVKNKQIDGDLEYEEYDHNEPYLSPYTSTVKVESLKLWMRSRGFERHFFFFPEGEVGEFLNENHPRYSSKLAAAIKAWKALDNEALLKGTTPKKAVQKWLRQNAVEFNLCDGDGKPVESAIEEISKVVNWNPRGGAPATPISEEPLEKPRKVGKFSIEKPQPIESVEFIANCDPDGVPF